MDRPTGPAVAPDTGSSSPAAEPAREPVQRWRITFARDPVPAEAVGRATIDAWQAALAESGLPTARTNATDGAPRQARARFSIAAPLPASASGRAELAELWLVDRVPAWTVREALADRLPPGHHWRHAEDVWLGAPPLPGQVVAADWIVTLSRSGADPAALAAAARGILAARSLPRMRTKAGADRPYDLRPLLEDVTVTSATRDDVVLRIVTKLDPALGSGRPEEVVGAIGDAARLDPPPAIEAIVRARLVLADAAGVAGSARAANGPRRGPRLG